LPVGLPQTFPTVPHTVAFGTTRVVPINTPMVTFESGQYSVPHVHDGHSLLGATVWVRTQGVGVAEQVVIVHVSQDRPTRSPATSGPHPEHHGSTTSTSRPVRNRGARRFPLRLDAVDGRDPPTTITLGDDSHDGAQ
jgi:hypothetical protein